MSRCGLFVVDVQEKLFAQVDRNCEVLRQLLFLVEAAKLFEFPIVVTEQYPEGLGSTVAPLKEVLPEDQPIYTKTAFSGMCDKQIRAAVEALPVDKWIVVGIEAHICVWQTARDLAANKEVIVLSDAISSTSIYDFSSAIADLKDFGIRVTSSKTFLYEWMGDAKHPLFKELLALVKNV